MLEGHLLSERYRIERTIGGGGMANVYLARDIILDRDVAIKVLRPEFANDPEFIERFDREAKAATSLSHSNIVNIYDVGEENDILYMAMEYVDGLTLKEYILEYGPLPVEKSIDIMKQLTDAIAHAHMNGLIHRDIKPQNMLMDHYGNVKVTDFGIAIALSATSLTQTNSILGSVHYLSPEQARGGTATKKSDIYSLGILFYELLTSKLPFFGQSPISIALKHLQDETPSVRGVIPDVPQSVENIVLKATAKDPFHRYESVFDMETALDIALDPGVRDEAAYAPPEEEGEATKAIPIITEEQLNGADADETLVHNDHQSTKTDPSQQSATDTSEKPKKKKKFYKRKSFIFFIILFFIIIAGVVYFALSKPKMIDMPDVVEAEYEEAKEALEEENLKVNKKMMSSEEVEEGLVIKTDPKANRQVKEKSIVDVFVSEGKEKVTFKDYVGKDFDQIKGLLEDEGYKEVISYPKASDEPEGDIVAQTEPNEGDEVVPAETKVIFEVSSGPETFTLMRLTGLTLDEAKEYADDNGLTLDVSEEHDDSVDEGKVISQSPEANTEMTKGSEVKVTKSLGKKESPPKSHSVTFTIPYEPDEESNNQENNDETETENDDEEPAGQDVQIYVDDKDNSISDVFHEETITKDEEYELTLVIEPDGEAAYKVVRDGETILDKTVSY